MTVVKMREMRTREEGFCPSCCPGRCPGGAVQVAVCPDLSPSANKSQIFHTFNIDLRLDIQTFTCSSRAQHVNIAVKIIVSSNLI
jgi:hypothetical protein